MVLCADMASEQEIREERIHKVARMRERGIEPYPAASGRDLSCREFKDRFDELERSKEEHTIAGRVRSTRGQGGIVFADISDGEARVQLVFQKDAMDAALFDQFVEFVDQSDFIEAGGVAGLTKRGEQSLMVSTWRMLAKSLRDVPDEWYGLKDEEKILRERYLDILLNESVREMFVRRGKFWQAMRDFYLARGFLEVETPALENSPGGADARPFVTHHNALDIDVYLRISAGELWQKRLLVAGYSKVFEIGRIFRNEGQSREHLQDYTQLESYEAYNDMKEGMAFIQDLYRSVAHEVYGSTAFDIHGHSVDLAAPWATLNFGELVQEHFGIDPLACTEEEAVRAVRDAKIEVGEELNLSRAVDHLWKSIRKSIGGPSFLTGIPAYLEPLAKRATDDLRVVERVQVILAGSEMGKGFSELNDPQDQLARFEEQQRLRDSGDDEAQRLDLEYVRAMEYGMPPAFGFGVSERLFAFLENRPAHESQIFPLLRPRPQDS